MHARKVGGIWFARVGRVQVSLCVCKRKPSPPRPDRAALFFLDGITLALCAAIVAHMIGG